jgi:hypothetical protein
MGKYVRVFAEQSNWDFVGDKLESTYNETQNWHCDNRSCAITAIITMIALAAIEIFVENAKMSLC